jgi:hypothetical protein
MIANLAGQSIIPSLMFLQATSGWMSNSGYPGLLNERVNPGLIQNPSFTISHTPAK